MNTLGYAREVAARLGLPPEWVELRDGRQVQLRPLSARDANAEQHFVRGLSATSRVLRFHIGLHELAPGLLRALTDIDQRSHVALAAWSDDESDAAIVADARYVLLDDSSQAEFAIAVADDWQGLGLGRKLMARLVTHARQRGVTHLVGEVLHENARMLAMVRRMGGTMHRHTDATLVTVRFVL